MGMGQMYVWVSRKVKTLSATLSLSLSLSLPLRRTHLTKDRLKPRKTFLGFVGAAGRPPLLLVQNQAPLLLFCPGRPRNVASVELDRQPPPRHVRRAWSRLSRPARDPPSCRTFCTNPAFPRPWPRSRGLLWRRRTQRILLAPLARPRSLPLSEATLATHVSHRPRRLFVWSEPSSIKLPFSKTQLLPEPLCLVPKVAGDLHLALGISLVV